MADFFGSLYAYPWDLTDEPGALDRILATGCREVMVAASYHVSTYFLPHNPVRPIYWGEDGALYFRPRTQRTYLRPRISSVVERQDYFERLAQRIKDHGLQLGVWIVYYYNHHLAEESPEVARHDAFDNPYLGQLSAMHPTTAEYAEWLTQYVLENFKPSAIHVESLNRMNWDYGFRNPKVLSPISERCQFLLGVDFNLYAQDPASRRENLNLQHDVREWLRPRLARLPTASDKEPVTEEWIRSAFDGRLAFYLETARAQTTATWVKIAKMIHEKGAKVQSGLVTPASVWRTDLSEECNSYLDRVTVAPGLNSFQIEAIKKKIPQSGTVMVSTQPGGMTEAGPLVQQIQSAQIAGCKGATFYNYGLLREEQVRFIGQAMKSI